ncbi:hypothetical protein [Rickettsia endosymbiont of Urophora cardui]
MLKQYIKYIVILLMTIGIVKASIAVNYQELSDDNLREAFYSKRNEIKELRAKIGGPTVRENRQTQSTDIMNNITAISTLLQKEQEHGVNNYDKVLQYQDQIAQLHENLNYLIKQDEISIEYNKNLNILQNEFKNI